eukprot:GHVR01112229.1.p1 GENE.GHVR01112229.1~~GHVR01112229.1.p1  ORF type:complete len:233 (+),score=25.83 GHVR01112229.1:176-874(+)
MKTKNILYSVTAISALCFLSACDSDNDDKAEMMPVTYSYQVAVKNLTYAQPISPVAVVLHNEGSLWKIGESASVALETMAESGDNAALLSGDNVIASTSGAGVVMPSMSETVTVSIENTMPMYLSVATMLVNTNDGFTGLNTIDISSLAVDESMSFMPNTYDAGTEKNTELMGTIPGPADGGEGFNAARDDVNVVSMHPGVVTVDDGLTTSVLTQAHKFDNPSVSITITRME